MLCDNIDILDSLQASFISDCWRWVGEQVRQGSEASRRLEFGSFTAAPNMIDLTCHFPCKSTLRKAINYQEGAGN